jgi:hypothetical protein
MGVSNTLEKTMAKTGKKSILRKIKRKDKETGQYVFKWNEPIENFFKAVKLGMNNVKATEFAGFSDKVLYKWINQGEADLEEGLDTIFVEFVDTLKKTRAECQAFHLQNVIRAGRNGNWQASAWILERLFPTSFGANRTETNEEDRIEVVNDVPKR